VRLAPTRVQAFLDRAASSRLSPWRSRSTSPNHSTSSSSTVPSSWRRSGIRSASRCCRCSASRGRRWRTASLPSGWMSIRAISTFTYGCSTGPDW